MRVRVWIHGPDGPSHDFELISAPRVGERLSINSAAGVEEGVVDAVNWQLQAVDANAAELALEGEPPGSVSLVHVICRPVGEVIRSAFAAATVDDDEPVEARVGEAS